MTTPSSEDQPDNSQHQGLGLVWIPILVAAALALAYGANFGYRLQLPEGSPSSWGEFGDFFGGLLNPVVGIITIVLLVKTFGSQQRAIDMQREELQLQRTELALQREENAKATEALAAQNKAITLQSFEQTLFKWFDNYRQTINDFQFRSETNSSTVLRGLEAVRAVNKELTALTSEVRSHFSAKYTDDAGWFALDQKLIEDNFTKVVTRIQRVQVLDTHAGITTAVRTLFLLLHWVYHNPIFKTEHKRRQIYLDLIRAQLTEHELRIVFAFGLTAGWVRLAKLTHELGIFRFMRGTAAPIFTTILMSDRNPYTPSALGNTRVPAMRYKKERTHTVPEQEKIN